MHKVFNGVVCEQINTIEVQTGDYVLFNMRGIRARRVKEVVMGRKRRFLKFEPLPTPVFKSLTVKLDDVVSAWRSCEANQGANTSANESRALDGTA